MIKAIFKNISKFSSMFPEFIPATGFTKRLVKVIHSSEIETVNEKYR